MNNTIKKLILFFTGAAVGSASTYVTYKYTKAKKMDAEFEEMRDIYKKKIEEISKTVDAAIEKSQERENTPEEKSITNQVKPSVKKMAKDYQEAAEKYSAEKNMTKPSRSLPKVIKPEEFGEIDDYECVTLTYIEKDEIFLDVSDEIVDAAMRNVGKANLNHFSDYEPDVLYVRNESLGIDYEIILKEDITYKEYMTELYGEED